MSSMTKHEAVLTVDTEDFTADMEEATDSVKDLNAELEELAELMDELGVDSLGQLKAAVGGSDYVADLRDREPPR